jgi:hypothetical protein
MRKHLLFAVSILGAACTSLPDMPPDQMNQNKPDALATTGCDPLVPGQCGFPFPSDVWLVDDPKTVTGHHVQFGPQTLPEQAHKTVDTATWAGSDGFSPGMTVLTLLPGATVTGLPNENTLPLSITPTSPTILLNTRTGQLVPHIAELDMSTDDPSQQTFMLRPVVRLDDNTRYIVAIRNVVDQSGKALPPSPAFQALRDGSDFADASIDRRRTKYADIFAQLAKAGIDKANLQLAWDYSTASRENNTRTMIAMRDAALAVVGDAGPSYTITDVKDNPNQHIRRRILGTMHVPLYLSQDTPGGHMVVDENGLPKQNGFADYPFLVQIPNSAVNGTPGAILQNGHGLLGHKEEGQDGYMATICDTKNFVEIAVDLIGFAADDVDTFVDVIARDLGGFKGVIDRQQQGMINQLLAMRMMKGNFAKDPMVQVNGKSAIDPTHSYYRGDSQGGIMGTTYMAISTDVTRGLLGEPGMPYSLLLNRSEDFELYSDLLQAATSSNFPAIQQILGLMQMLWDRSEPDGFAPYITANPLPGTPVHSLLLNIAIGDHQVTPLGAHVIARTIGAKNLKPVNREVFAIQDADGPFTGSGMTEFDFGLPPAPITNVPMKAGDDPHDKVRSLPTAIDQTDTFLRTGVIQNYCNGMCKGM